MTPNQVMLGEPTGAIFTELDPPEHRLRRRIGVGCQKWITSCDQVVFVDEAAEHITTA